MGKLIAIWGPPGAGKTTFAVKLGLALQENTGMHVYTVLCDTTTPALPVLFPRIKTDDMYSIGFALSKVHATQNEIEACTVSMKSHPDLAFLGYKDGENHFSYPATDVAKNAELLMTLTDMADAVIVDCTAVPDNMSKAAMANADIIFRVVSPDLKSVSFCSSQLPLLVDPVYQCDNHITIINEIANDVYSPVYEASQYFSNVEITLPYCHDIRMQSFNGDLLNSTRSKKYNKQMIEILNKIVAE